MFFLSHWNCCRKLMQTDYNFIKSKILCCPDPRLIKVFLLVFSETCYNHRRLHSPSRHQFWLNQVEPPIFVSIQELRHFNRWNQACITVLHSIQNVKKSFEFCNLYSSELQNWFRLAAIHKNVSENGKILLQIQVIIYHRMEKCEIWH